MLNPDERAAVAAWLASHQVTRERPPSVAEVAAKVSAVLSPSQKFTVSAVRRAQLKAQRAAERDAGA